MDPQPPAPQAELDDPVGPSHARRAVGLIAAAALVVAVAGAAYLHPSFGGPSQAASGSLAKTGSSYQLSGLDFVTPTTGWAVATFDDGDYLVMRTTNGGESWGQELSGPTGGHGTYLKFFDSRDGVFALVGARPLLYRTFDGGVTWSQQAALTARAAAVSWSFTDPAHGWMLVRKDPLTPGSTDIYRTADGGFTWVDLGSPVKAPDIAFGVEFAGSTTGWLVSASSGAYAYRSDDSGTSWSRVSLPAPTGGWPPGGQFLVSAQPTRGSGVITTVVNFPTLTGKAGVGATIVGYPPLTVRAYDGGAPIIYGYGISSDGLSGQAFTASDNIPPIQAPGQAVLASLDGGDSWESITLPEEQGAIGIADQSSWWWIGSGGWSRTFDAGRTWTAPRNIAVPPPLAGSLEILDPRHAWFASNAGSRPSVVSTDDGGVHWRSAVLPPMTGRFTP